MSHCGHVHGPFSDMTGAVQGDGPQRTHTPLVCEKLPCSPSQNPLSQWAQYRNVRRRRRKATSHIRQGTACPLVILARSVLLLSNGP